MAFVSRAERSFDHSPNKGFNLGPGAYLGQEQHRLSHAYAPFTSTAQRNVSQSLVSAPTPGPGSYSTPDLNSKSVLDQYGQLRPSGPFASRQSRFKAANSRLAPGPGAYQVEKSWIKPRTISPRKEIVALNWLRLPSAPSIPALKQAFGYDETPNGELIMQKNPEKVFDGTPEDCVGPGHYETKKPGEHAKGLAWGRSKGTKGVDPQPSTSPDIGPGSYNQLPGSLAPMYKFQPSAVFQSGTKRSSFVPPPGKSIAETNATEEMDVLEQDSSVPGPGYYYSEQMSAFKARQVPERLQFFGSTAARFDYKKAGNAKVGPGSYAVVTAPGAGSRKSEMKAPFASTDMRFQHREKIEKTPGPGSYKDQQFLDDLKEKAWGRQGVFGTTEKRFPVLHQPEPTPGPGYYPSDLDKRIGMHNSANYGPLAVFQSRTKRTGELIKAKGPAPGQYELPSSFSPSKPVVQASGNPLLAGLGEIRKKEAPFDAKSHRFPATSVSMQSLGPGAYDPKLPQDKHVDNQRAAMPQVRTI